ncbi:MAG: hypothetical protein IT307_19655 [Chloroflexi bacterium]|nr:hypothetical protein [Chloroflexota bacterium]
MARLVRRVLHRLIRSAVRARIVMVAVLVLVVAGGVSAAIMSGGSLAGGFSGPSLSFPVGQHAPEATESFLKGQQTANADLVWSSFSDDVLSRMRAQGATKVDYQRRLEAGLQSGAKLEQLSYVGGQSLPDGTSMHFYVVAQRSGQSRGDAVDYVPYTFILNRVGKIDKVL